MVTPNQCAETFGNPDIKFEQEHMMLWNIPDDLRQEIPALPKRVYCNKLLQAPLEKALRNLIAEGCADELETWDGCFNIRKSRGLSSQSLHSWAIAIDVNAADNGLGREPKLSAKFVSCFTSAGFDWGGSWRRKDGMHFQLSKI